MPNCFRTSYVLTFILCTWYTVYSQQSKTSPWTHTEQHWPRSSQEVPPAWTRWWQMELTLLHNNSILYNRELQSEDQKAQQCFFKDGKKPGGLQAGNSCDVHLQVLTA